MLSSGTVSNANEVDRKILKSSKNVPPERSFGTAPKKLFSAKFHMEGPLQEFQFLNFSRTMHLTNKCTGPSPRLRTTFSHNTLYLAFSRLLTFL